MVATTKRHPSIVRHRTGVTRDGRLTAMEIDVLHGRRRLLHALPRRALARRPSTPPAPTAATTCAMRGRVVDDQHAAQRRLPRLRRAADAVRRRGAHGAHRRGARHGSGAAAGDQRAASGRHDGHRAEARHGRSALQVLREAVRRTDFRSETQALAPARTRGIGLSLFFHGSGFTGGARSSSPRRPRLELTETGARILVASTEIGQGTRTMHAQIVADALGVPYDARRGRRRRHRARARQRPDGRVAHLHDRRQDPRELRPRR